MGSIANLIKTALVKLMERESFVDVLQALFTFVLAALTVRLALMLFDLEAFTKDAGAYFAITSGGAATIYLVFSLFNRSATVWLKVYFLLAFLACTAINGYKILTGTYVPILQ